MIQIFGLSRPRRLSGRFSITLHLTALCCSLLVPVLLFCGVLTHAYFDSEERGLRGLALDHAGSILSAVDQEVLNHVRALRALARAPSLERDDLPAFLTEARVVSRVLGGGRVTFWNGRGTPLLTTGPDLPGAPPDHQGKPDFTVTGLQALRGGGFEVLIAVPLQRPDGGSGTLGIAVGTDQLQRVVQGIDLPSGWVGTLLDGDGRVIARTEQAAEFLGRQVAGETLAHMRTSPSFLEVSSFSGAPVLLTHVGSAVTGLHVNVLLPASILESPLRSSFRLLGPAAAWLAALAMALTLIFARRITRPVARLARLATEMGLGGKLRQPPIPIRELAEVAAAMTQAGIALQRRQHALAESDARLQRALSAARMAAWELEVRADRLNGSPGREALYGRLPGSLNSRAKIFETMHPEDRRKATEALKRAYDPEGSGHYEMLYRVIWPDGQVRWLHSQGAVVDRDPSGAPLRLSGVVMDVTQAREAAEREKLLISEVDHRARNVLAVVQSVLRMSRAEDPRNFTDAVRGRVSALSRAHTLLARERWNGSDLHDLAREVLGPELGLDRLSLHGPRLALAAFVVQPLTMVLHELATNAVRHGALRVPAGRVSLSWQLERDVLQLTWHESGGPETQAPPLRSFGLKLVESTIQHQLRGRVDMVWRPEGLICHIGLDAERVLRREQPAPGKDAFSEAAMARLG